MAITLPDDILNQISIQLWYAHDFDTLFRFALCSKQLAALGLANLYKMQDIAPIRGAHEMEAQGRKPDEQVRRWAILWRSIILSTMEGKTIFPYCRYIRVLDLQDFTGLLEDLGGGFKEHQKTLFTKDLKKFRIFAMAPNKHRGLRLDLAKVPVAVGEEVTKHTPFLEELGGELTRPELEKWIARLPKLKAFRLYDGAALEGCHTVLKKNCPSFRHLYLYNWMSTDADSDYAKFLNGLYPNTLESVEVIYSFMEEQSLKALASHYSSLRVLRLHGLINKSLAALPELKGAIHLNTVLLGAKITANEPPELFAAFEEIAQWLSSCKDLQSLVLQGLEIEPKIATTVLLNPKLKLQHLEVSGYDMVHGRQLHRALLKHSSLQSLSLSGDPKSCVRDDIETLVESLCSLENLKKLRLVDISDYFADSHICMIARALPLLEEFWVSGYHITDAVWDDLSKIKSLKLLSFQAMSKFTPEGIMGFVKTLDDKRGMQLEILYSQDPMSNSDREAIEKEIACKGGSLVFTMWREEDDSSDDSEID